MVNNGDEGSVESETNRDEAPLSTPTSSEEHREKDSDFYANPSQSERKVVIVGNGESLRGSNMGSVIDSYETIVRFNHFRTKGFEKDVGRRTSVWVLAQIRDPDVMDAEEVKEIHTVLSPFALRPCADQMRPCAPNEIIKKKAEEGKKKMNVWKAKIESSSVVPEGAKVSVSSMPGNIRLYDRYGLVEKFPSSGLQVINYFLEKFKSVSIVGFDFERANHQHYWERKIKDETCHNMNGEAKVIDAMIAEGVVQRIGLRPREKDLKSSSYDPNCKIICDQKKGQCAKITGLAFKKYETMKVKDRQKKPVTFWKALQKEMIAKEQAEEQRELGQSMSPAQALLADELFKNKDLGIGMGASPSRWKHGRGHRRRPRRSGNVPV